MITFSEVLSAFNDIDNDFSICEDDDNFYITLDGIITPNQIMYIENNLYSIIGIYNGSVNSYSYGLYTCFLIKK